jgi:prephenate dehydrogenase
MQPTTANARQQQFSPHKRVHRCIHLCFGHTPAHAARLHFTNRNSSGNIRSVDAKGFKGIKPWPEVTKAQRAAAGLVAGRSKDLLAGVKPGNEQAAQAALESLRKSVDELGAAAETQDRFGAVTAQIRALKALDRLGTLEVGFGVVWLEGG